MSTARVLRFPWMMLSFRGNKNPCRRPKGCLPMSVETRADEESAGVLLIVFTEIAITAKSVRKPFAVPATQAATNTATITVFSFTSKGRLVIQSAWLHEMIQKRKSSRLVSRVVVATSPIFTGQGTTVTSVERIFARHVTLVD